MTIDLLYYERPMTRPMTDDPRFLFPFSWLVPIFSEEKVQKHVTK
jgi:hypothetical protein